MHIKRKLIVVALFIVMTINSFAAVVSDNDGAAFITKAEFDTLKNDFQSQIDVFNKSIDNKIDTAISSYLEGIVLSNNVDLINYYKSYEESNNCRILWTAETNINASGTPTLVNYGNWIITSNYMLNNSGSTNARNSSSTDYIGRMTYGYAKSTTDYDNQYYNILKLKDGKAVGRVKYSPIMQTSVTYLSYDSTNSWTANLEFWKDDTHLSITQTESGKSQSWAGNRNNATLIKDGRGFASANILANMSDTVIDFVMAPKCTTQVACWNSDDETSLTSSDEGSAPPSTPTYSAPSIQAGTNGGSGVLNSINSQILYMPHWNETLPWIDLNKTLNEVKINLFNNDELGAAEMKYGLPITKVQNSGTVCCVGTLAAGDLGWYAAKANGAKKTWNDISATSKIHCDGTSKINIKIDVENNDLVYFIYLPTSRNNINWEEFYMIAKS